MKNHPAEITLGNSLRSPSGGRSLLSSFVPFSQEVTYPGRVFPSANSRTVRIPTMAFWGVFPSQFTYKILTQALT